MGLAPQGGALSYRWVTPLHVLSLFPLLSGNNWKECQLSIYRCHRMHTRHASHLNASIESWMNREVDLHQLNYHGQQSVNLCPGQFVLSSQYIHFPSCQMLLAHRQVVLIPPETTSFEASIVSPIVCLNNTCLLPCDPIPGDLHCLDSSPQDQRLLGRLAIHCWDQLQLITVWLCL